MPELPAVHHGDPLARPVDPTRLFEVRPPTFESLVVVEQQREGHQRPISVHAQLSLLVRAVFDHKHVDRLDVPLLEAEVLRHGSPDARRHGTLPHFVGFRDLPDRDVRRRVRAVACCRPALLSGIALRSLHNRVALLLRHDPAHTRPEQRIVLRAHCLRVQLHRETRLQAPQCRHYALLHGPRGSLEELLCEIRAEDVEHTPAQAPVRNHALTQQHLPERRPRLLAHKHLAQCVSHTINALEAWLRWGGDEIGPDRGH
mmetsp:Transcript_45621/g.111046  ORF Transcript_45621/g.111046 Transcript_45621/m.111046 type:complete len:258 (-) Transcript_45621:136-909(-)